MLSLFNYKKKNTRTQHYNYLARSLPQLNIIFMKQIKYIFLVQIMNESYLGFFYCMSYLII